MPGAKRASFLDDISPPINSLVTGDAARRLWTRAAGDATAPGELIAAAERLCVQLRLGLGRWIGAEGYRALLDRALRQTRADHPPLVSLSCDGAFDPAARASLRERDAAEVAAGMVALLTAVIELLGRIIGDEMAMRLVEQIGTPRSHDVVNILRKGRRDG